MFMNTLAEAIDVTMGHDGGVRMWNTPDAGRRFHSALCADDLLGMITGWSAAHAYFLTLDRWGFVSESRFGIADNDKTTYAPARHGAGYQ